MNARIPARRSLILAGAAVLALPVWARDDEGEYRILQARYGTNERNVDVTDRLRDLARKDVQFRLENEVFGIDPDPGRTKTLRIFAEGRDGRQRSFEYREHSRIDGAMFIGWGGGNWGRDRREQRWDHHDDGDWQILEARYGTGQRNVDVTGRLRELARDDYRFRVTNEGFGVDPDPGRRKSLRIYAQGRDGSQRMFEVPEGGTVDGAQFTGWSGGGWGRGGWRGGWGDDQGMDQGPQRPYEPGGGDLHILEARYGSDGQQYDVTDRLRAMRYEGRLDLRVSNEMAGGDPAPGVRKTLWVRYRVGHGPVQEARVEERDHLRLP